MNQSVWVSVIFVATVVRHGICRPQEVEVKNIYPIYREEKQLQFETPNSSPTSTKEVKVTESGNTTSIKDVKPNIEAIATVARASSGASALPSSPTIGQLVDAVNQMVESDIRTPPKLKEIIKEKTKEPHENSTPLPYTFIYDDSLNRMEGQATDKTLLVDLSEGKASSAKISDEGVKGIAIPVVMDDDYESPTPPKKLQKIPEISKPIKQDKKNATKIQLTTTPSSGLSTWILLSDNKDMTTPFPKKNNKNEDKKKTTTKSNQKLQTTTQKSTAKKTTTKKPEMDTTSVLEAMVKKKGVTTIKPKLDDVKTTKKPTDLKKKIVDRLENLEAKDKVEIEIPTYTIPTNLPIVETNDSTQTTESAIDGTTKKKSNTKKKKKNKNRRRKPTEETGIEAKIPKQPMGSQIYNFLSREIVPTVGLGLIGVALTAGLASFLGYNPFGSTAVPLRRTYDTHHGYSSNNYYNYNTDYGDSGQSEEVLFREVLSGMPEESRYGLTHTDTYSEAYNRQDYENGPTYQYPEKDAANYDSYSQDYSTGYGTHDTQDKSYNIDKNKYPVYNRESGTSFVYPETTQKTDTIERQPEALYRVASESDLQYRNSESAIQGISSQNSWHRIGSPVDYKPKLLEPGPRSLNPTKEVKKRTKRESVIQRISPKRTKKQNNIENEVDFEDAFSDNKIPSDFSATMTATPTTTTTRTTTTAIETSTATTIAVSEEIKDVSFESTESYEEEPTAPPPSGVSVLDVLKRLAQFKLRLGLNFLRSTTDLFSRYLEDIQKRVDESFANSTTTTVQYNRRKSPWSRILYRDEYAKRKRRSALKGNDFEGNDEFLPAMLTGNTNDGFSKSTKKDLRESNKIFHQKKNSPKKYEPKRAN